MSSIYGFYSGAHDASIVYIKDGEILSGIQEERLSRIKSGDEPFSFPFLVWNHKLKWIMICGSIMLHTGIGLLMGLTTFSLCMITLVLSFVPPAFIKNLIDRYGIGPFKRSAV